EMGMDVGADELRSYAEGFGIGEAADIGVETAPGNIGEMPDDAAVGQSSIGQRDGSMSALQAAGMAAPVANDGVRMKPYLVNRITAPTMNDVRTTAPPEPSTAASEEVAAPVTAPVCAPERSPSGYDGHSYAAKTGTAEHGDGLPPRVWYVAFDPERDIAVGVVVKTGGNLGESATGGQVSAPIGRAILDNYGGGQ